MAHTIPAPDILAPDALGPTVCIGEILVEIMAKTPGNTLLEAQTWIGPFPSGAPAIFIDQCGKISGNAAMIGAVGNDDFGRINLKRLAADNVDISGIAVDPDYPTGSAFVRYQKDGSRKFIFNIAKSAAARFVWTDIVSRVIARAGHLHIMGSALVMPNIWPVIEKALKILKSKGGTLSLDPNLRSELTYDRQIQTRFARLIEATDLLLPSGAELECAAAVKGENAALQSLFQRGVKEIVLKRGAQGATCFQSGKAPVNALAFAVQEVDPTGAGDCFGGAYVACRRMGLLLTDVLTYACAAGARNVTQYGPMEGTGTRSQLDAFIQTTKRMGK